jgi:uncharacterized protein (DUF1697 family)
MARYAAFLRGINLASRNRISSDELREIFEGMGLEDVAPFRTSGNVVFAGPKGPTAKLGERIGREIEAKVGFEVITFVRTERELVAMADHQPFRPALLKSRGKLQVVLMAKTPSAATRDKVLALGSDDDRLAFEGRELYWLPRGGTRESALDKRKLDELLRPLTQRTKGTIEEIARKFFA